MLHDTDASLAELVDLKFFCGFSTADIAAMRRVSTRTVERDWQKSAAARSAHVAVTKHGAADTLRVDG